MKKFISALILAGAVGSLPVWAQEKKDMPIKGPMQMKEGMPMKNEGMKGGGMQMQEMQRKMAEMHKGMGGMMKEKGMMKSDDMQVWGK